MRAPRRAALALALSALSPPPPACRSRSARRAPSFARAPAQFFDAIRFVFGDAMGDSIRADSRATLMHEGAGAGTVLQGHVEVVLDNSDGRLPLEGDEATLRRAVGLKKDEYFLNKKKVLKGDFSNVSRPGAPLRSLIGRRGNARVCTRVRLSSAHGASPSAQPPHRRLAAVLRRDATAPTH